MQKSIRENAVQHRVLLSCRMFHFVPSNAQYSHEGTKLCIFENNEEVIKMIMNGRSPTLRHLSTTHRVALDWLFNRIE